jgi:uracil-DNA glycosylase
MRVTPLEAASTLGWLVAAGVDVIVDDAPRNWLAAPPGRPAPLAERQTATAATRQQAATPASAIAAVTTDLPALDAALATFNHPLRRPSPPQLLTGAVTSGCLILIDQPGAGDAAAALLLGRMLAAIGLDATNCATGHLLPWSTPAGRPPRDEEIAAFAPFLAHALTLASPRLILAFGDRAAHMGQRADGPTGRGIASTRGKWLTVNDVPMIATFHPRQVLAQPELKRLAWADLQAFAHRLGA